MFLEKVGESMVLIGFKEKGTKVVKDSGDNGEC